jgi:hypothetical protein
MTEKVGEMLTFEKFKSQSPKLILCIVAVLGFINIPNVGISWDEPAQRLSAGLSVIKIVNKIDPEFVPSSYSEFSSQANDLAKNAPFDHGVAFDAPILALEVLFGIDSTRGIYLLHHVVNWLGYLVGLAAMYLFIFQIYKRRDYALLAGAFYLLSPRILAEGFYNSKDLTFLSFLLLSSYLVLKIWDGNNRIKYAILAGVVGGYATDIRILGLVQLPIVALVFFLVFLNGHETIKNSIKQFSFFVASFSLTVYAFFPYLWENPIGNLIKVFKSMSKYNWDGYVLYAGDRIQAQELPWHYIPVWISITTPILYLALFAVGIFGVTYALILRVRDGKLNIFDISQLFAVLMFFVPLIIVIGLNSTLYDAWRHMYFIYPFLVAIAIYGYSMLERNLKSKKIFLNLALLLSLTSTSVWIVANNPQQNLYFNQLAGEQIPQRWEMDYWGLSNESALRFILENDSREKITLQEVSFTPLELSSKMLNQEEQSRLIFERKTVPESDYIVNNFRSGSTESIASDWQGYRSVKEFKVDGFTYLEILKKIE